MLGVGCFKAINEKDVPKRWELSGLDGCTAAKR